MATSVFVTQSLGGLQEDWKKKWPVMNGFQALLTFLSIIVTADTAPSEKHNGPGNVYHGRYTRDIHEPEFLIPRRVFKDGSFNTYSLPNFYDRQEISERRKRSIAEGEQESESDKLHLVLPFNGIEHHVELDPYHEFISPDMVIETRGAGLRHNLNEALRFKRADDQQCHYRGFVRGHDPSRAALSLCDGVVGYVQTNHGRYFIEPAHETEPQEDGQHVHIAYKRDATHRNKEGQDTSERRCGTSDKWEVAWAEQLANRQKRLMEDNPGEQKKIASHTHSIHRYIEIGLVADRRFLDYYNNSNYEQYLLTIMNMAADFYHDRSVGNQIDVVVVRMIYLEKEKEEIDLLISPAAEDTLNSFAKWAQKMNPKDHSHPNHFDIAVLVTRYDICAEVTQCELMGLAFVGTACEPQKAACINEDSGLALGIVIAHEVGHVMGCSHDTLEISGCPSQDKDTSYFIMSPYVYLFTIRWSTCSKKFITNLLDSGLGECLNDNPRSPSEKFKYPNMLPGAMYDGDFQCQMKFPGSTLCAGGGAKMCSQLWCAVNKTSCLTRGSPMADGTKCGENKWCIHKECVDMGTRPKAVNGGWGQWGPMGTCSRTCGGGLKYAERECDNPPPANKGRYCIGERRRLAICNTVPCDPKEPSFRTLQCKYHDYSKFLSIKGNHTWTVYNDPKLDPCGLYCINELMEFLQVEPVANDSTPCKPGTNNMCISGICRTVGCDWVLDSNAVEDKCGICKGDGTKCKKIKGFYNDTTPVDRHTKVVTIPKGARSIHISERARNKNALSVRLEKNETAYCLNAGLRLERSGDYSCAKAVLVYLIPEPDREEIEIKGPIAEDIRVEYVYYQPYSNPGINYEYYVMSGDTSYTPKYIWDFTEWTGCNAKCGGGTMISEATCIEEHGGKVSADFCESIPRPEPKSRICNADPCIAKWRVSQWSKCSACDGKKGTRHRKVQCVRPAARAGEDDVQANLDACKGRVPKQTEECVGQRPCRKQCPKKARNVNREAEVEKEKKLLPLDEQDKMVDKFVDLGLARYLEKAYGVPRDSDEMEKTSDTADFRDLLREWSLVDEDKNKHGVCVPNITTPKPGSIIKDSVPIENVILLEAPFVEGNLQSNLSDRAFQETGDLVGVGIDTSKTKVFTGAEAVQKIEQLEGHKHTTPPNRKEINTYDKLARIVDFANH
ncbi:PREDICTED: A disintegrin and metalloproteinase with thrombospondin motifs 7-like [Eufriesea mexicana]|uniref:A disintegrin and metalloproteinase with thrombospondin motifs 7-like n=1 Tax=Eufriesea mexicana TaxID=516756 RepID=UPI00083BDE44|nr:PREDICTED: A disintegrin and metalloproteinase with thrombospondin motifs 7-like [Eufriesea mexicana]